MARAASGSRHPRGGGPRRGRRRPTRAPGSRRRPSAAPRRPLTVDAEGGPWDRFEPLRRDRPAAARAGAVGPGVEPGQRGVDLGEVLLVALAEGEVALLLEDLASGGGLGAVGHRAGGDDALGEAGPEAVTLGLERRSRVGRRRGVGRHRRIVRPFGVEPVGPSRDILAGALTEEPGTMAIAIDPVCGMEVDTDLTDLKLEHEGKTYWFCGKG